MERQFKRIPAFPKYIISDRGTVINTRSGNIRKQAKNAYGYCVVGMFKDKKRVPVLIHRLVAWAFLPNEGYSQINHINGVKHDNRVENLEWCSASHNNTHAYRVLNRSLPPNLLKGGERSKPCVVTVGKKIGTFASISEAAKENDCPKHIFLRIANGKKTERSKDFTVEFLN